MDELTFKKIVAHYEYYRQSLQPFYCKLRENNKWYRQEQDEEGSSGASIPVSRTGHLFNAIQYKHADFMDNYPHINILPREPGDEQEAKMLTGVVPFILDHTRFKKVYSQASYEKLKNGCACYGVFWNPDANDGLGEVEIRGVDLTRFAYQPNITDLQASKYVFYDSFLDIDAFESLYGKREGLKTQAAYEDYGDRPYHDLLSDNVVITDCYYKKRQPDGRVALHLVKFSGTCVLAETEGDPDYPDGIYRHGRYPFVFDVMHPLPDDITGLGIVDIAKSPQKYIDKLDAVINYNAMLIAKPRFLIRDNGGVNEDEFLDTDNTLIHVAGNVSDDNIRQLQADSLPGFTANHRAEKIQELKEVVGNRDFSQGATTGGVTAASAIAALQNSGDKLARDLINASYDAVSDVVSLVIELVREFYDEARTFRIVGAGAEASFVTYSNAGLRAADGRLRAPQFDVVLTIEKNNPFQRSQHNELILSLLQLGLFSKDNLETGLFVLSNMSFDGRDKLLEQLRAYKDERDREAAIAQLQQARTATQPQTAGGNYVAVPIA